MDTPALFRWLRKEREYFFKFTLWNLQREFLFGESVDFSCVREAFEVFEVRPCLPQPVPEVAFQIQMGVIGVIPLVGEVLVWVDRVGHLGFGGEYVGVHVLEDLMSKSDLQMA